MAGFIIALFLGVFYLTVLAILIGIFICMVLTYVFDSPCCFSAWRKSKVLAKPLRPGSRFTTRFCSAESRERTRSAFFRQYATLRPLSACSAALKTLISRILHRAFCGKPCRRLCVRPSHGVGRLQKRFEEIQRCFYHCKRLNAWPCPPDHFVCPPQ